MLVKIKTGGRGGSMWGRDGAAAPAKFGIAQVYPLLVWPSVELGTGRVRDGG
jgi:hypothetical protein